MNRRRFDTKIQMKKFLAGNSNAFNHIYERYSGRICRFIVRQCGTGPLARSLYLTTWAEFVDARKQYSSPNKYKMALYKILHEQMKNIGNAEKPTKENTQYATDRGDETHWRVKLLIHVRQLPKQLREVFLFRYEIGLSNTIIARILNQTEDEIEKKISQAIVLLEQEMVEADCHDEGSVLQIYRDSRILKSPSLWDKEIHAALPVWMEIGIQGTLFSEQVPGKGSLISNTKERARELTNHVRQKLFRVITPHRQTP